LPRGKQCYQEAMELDPQFASAHSELGLHYFVLASENQITAREAAVLMREEARTALQIDPSLAEAHAVLALVAVLEYDWKEAGRQFDLAMAQDSVPPMVRYFYGGFYLCPLARLPEALQQFELALREDPLNPVLRMTPGLCLLGAGDAAGEAELLKVLELNENFWIPLLWLAAYYLMQGRIQEALAFAERGYLQVPSHRGVIGQFAGILKSAGNAKRAQELLATLSSGAAFGEPIGFFGYHMACQEWELAAGWLEKAIEQRDTRAPWILPHLFGPGFTASPYWPKLAKMMNLP
jgi:Tfp pilus assembly protein PilF